MGLLPLELDGAPFSAEGLKSTKRVRATSNNKHGSASVPI